MTNIPKPPKPDNDYAVGTMVVFVDESKSDRLMTVFKVQGESVLLDGNRNFALNHLVRPATEIERQAKKRLPTDDPTRHYFEAIHYEHSDLHFVYTLNEYSDVKTQAKWSEFQKYIDSTEMAQGEVA